MRIRAGVSTTITYADVRCDKRTTYNVQRMYVTLLHDSKTPNRLYGRQSIGLTKLLYMLYCVSNDLQSLRKLSKFVYGEL